MSSLDMCVGLYICPIQPIAEHIHIIYWWVVLKVKRTTLQTTQAKGRSGKNRLIDSSESQKAYFFQPLQLRFFCVGTWNYMKILIFSGTFSFSFQLYFFKKTM
jgi:hypothetical protein